MGSFINFLINFMIGLILLSFLAGCASTGPSAEAPVCRGVAFSINQTSIPQTAGAK